MKLQLKIKLSAVDNPAWIIIDAEIFVVRYRQQKNIMCLMGRWRLKQESPKRWIFTVIM